MRGLSRDESFLKWLHARARFNREQGTTSITCNTRMIRLRIITQVIILSLSLSLSLSSSYFDAWLHTWLFYSLSAFMPHPAVGCIDRLLEFLSIDAKWHHNRISFTFSLVVYHRRDVRMTLIISETVIYRRPLPILAIKNGGRTNRGLIMIAPKYTR